MGGGMGRGMGGGMGRGMGGGMGRGMGGGMMPPGSQAPQAQTAGQELGALKAQSEILAEQLAEIQRRIDELGKKKK